MVSKVEIHGYSEWQSRALALSGNAVRGGFFRLPVRSIIIGGETCRTNMVKSKRCAYAGRAAIQDGVMEREIERKLQEIRYKNPKFTVRMISAVAAVACVALGFGVAIGWCARGGSFGGS